MFKAIREDSYKDEILKFVKQQRLAWLNKAKEATTINNKAELEVLLCASCSGDVVNQILGNMSHARYAGDEKKFKRMERRIPVYLTACALLEDEALKAWSEAAAGGQEEFDDLWEEHFLHSILGERELYLKAKKDYILPSFKSGQVMPFTWLMKNGLLEAKLMMYFLETLEQCEQNSITNFGKRPIKRQVLRIEQIITEMIQRVASHASETKQEKRNQDEHMDQIFNLCGSENQYHRVMDFAEANLGSTEFENLQAKILNADSPHEGFYYLQTTKRQIIIETKNVTKGRQDQQHQFNDFKAENYGQMLKGVVHKLWKETVFSAEGMREPWFHMQRNQFDQNRVRVWFEHPSSPGDDSGKQSCFYDICSEGIAVVEEYIEALDMNNAHMVFAVATTVIKDLTGEDLASHSTRNHLDILRA
jgi:hypothetical protein